MNTVITGKRIGVWLDHTRAHFVDISKGPAIVETAFSAKESELRYKGETGNGTQLGNNRKTNNESHIHNREQMIMDEYYKMLMDRLRNYDDILLFGPTSAKDELHNKMSADKHFASKSIHVASADQLTENQMVAQVRKFYHLE